MAKQLKLKAQVRSATGRSVAKELRHEGSVPANIYARGEAPRSLQIDKKEFANLLAHATSEHLLVDLEINEGGTQTNRLALIQEVQHHPLKGHVLHVDFHAVRADEKIHAAIPVEPVGEPTGVKNFGGILEVAVHEIEVECLPKDLPDMIRIDVTELGVGQVIHVRDLTLPEGVTARAHPDLTIISVAAPRVEAVVPAASSQPEVLKEKKPEGKTEDKK
jgi:large subunit ribosomal protein L25